MSRLPILMYHNICKDPTSSIGLSLGCDKLEAQFKYLVSKGYTTLHFSDIQRFKHVDDFPKKPIIITFDDVYLNQYELAYPLLEKYNLKACFYAPLAYVGGVDSWNDGSASLMSVSQLKAMDPKIVELGLHSFEHRPYDSLSLESIKQDFKKCKDFISKHDLNICNVLAYPYGKFPRNEPFKSMFINELLVQDVAFGLRIGNRLNLLPFKNNHELNRLDIKGEDSLLKFKLKLKLGKLSLF
jgi:peptidoglycan/xylan/chitin deacetylase (PgdA/CDA1 family)